MFLFSASPSFLSKFIFCPSAIYISISIAKLVKFIFFRLKWDTMFLLFFSTFCFENLQSSTPNLYMYSFIYYFYLFIYTLLLLPRISGKYWPEYFMENSHGILSVNEKKAVCVDPSSRRLFTLFIKYCEAVSGAVYSVYSALACIRVRRYCSTGASRTRSPDFKLYRSGN